MTSTTNRTRCLCGSHSSIDGGRRKRVVRSVGRKLARGKCPEGGANRRYDSNVEPTGPPGLKSDRLLESHLCASGKAIQPLVTIRMSGEPVRVFPQTPHPQSDSFPPCIAKAK